MYFIGRFFLLPPGSYDNGPIRTGKYPLAGGRRGEGPLAYERTTDGILSDARPPLVCGVYGMTAAMKRC
jgi:hypothetical protein